MAHSHDSVAHAWAHQSGHKNARRGFNMFYDGDTIYSYGRHFPIARIIYHNGKSCVLFTTRRASVSTAKHKTITWRACHHMNVFDVPFVEGTMEKHAANMEYYRDTVRELLVSSSRRRKADYAIMDIERAREMCERAADYREFFELDKRKKVFDAPVIGDDIGETIERLRIEADAQRERERVQREKLAAELREAQREAREKFERESLPAWRRGENVSLPWHLFGGASGVHYMRIKGDNIETSGRATFPISDAVRVWPILRRVRKSFESSLAAPVRHLSGNDRIKLGVYSIDKVSSEGVRAGCHFVEWSEIEHIARELDLIEAPNNA